jgi:hypothetical protein
MEFVLLRLDTTTKPSPMCRGDSNQYTACKGKPGNTTHARPPRPHLWPQFVTMIKESGRIPPFPNARLSHDTTHWTIQGYTILVYITIGEMRYRPTQHLSKLLSLRDPINSICVYIINACYTGPNQYDP